MRTIATSGRFGGGGLGRASRSLRPMTARQDMPLPHPIYGHHKIVTRAKLKAEAEKVRDYTRSLDRKYEKLASEKTAKANAKIRKQWDKHLKERSERRVFQW